MLLAQSYFETTLLEEMTNTSRFFNLNFRPFFQYSLGKTNCSRTLSIKKLNEKVNHFLMFETDNSQLVSSVCIVCVEKERARERRTACGILETKNSHVFL